MKKNIMITQGKKEITRRRDEKKNVKIKKKKDLVI